MRHSIFILIILSTAIVSFGIEVNVEYKWKHCEYEWENQLQQKNAINSGSFDPYLCPFFDAAKADGKLRIFFDLKDDTLVKTIYIPLDMATDKKGDGLLVAPITYIPGECTQFLDKMILCIFSLLITVI